MAQSSGFFNAQLDSQGNFDRVYLAEQFANYFSNFVGNGVFAHLLDKFAVTAGSGLRVNIAPGKAFVKGFWFESDETESLQIEIPDGVQNRKDNVVIRFDFQNRRTGLTVIKGTPSSDPVAPEVVRTQLIFDLKIAEVFVGASVSSISQSAITDTRSNSNVCGWVTGLVDQISTTDLFFQYQQAYTEWMQKMDDDEANFITLMQTFQGNFESNANAWYIAQKASFDAWMQTLTEELNVSGYIKKYLHVSDTYTNSFTLNLSKLDNTRQPDVMQAFFNGMYIATVFGTYNDETEEITFDGTETLTNRTDDRIYSWNRLLLVIDPDDYRNNPSSVKVKIYRRYFNSKWIVLDAANTKEQELAFVIGQWTPGVSS